MLTPSTRVAPSGVCPVTIGGKELGKEGLKYLPLIAVGFRGWVRVSITWGVGLLAPLVLLALWLGANRQLSGDKASNGPAKDKDKRVQTKDASATSAHPPVRGWQSELHAWKLAQVHLGELGRGDHVDRLSNIGCRPPLMTIAAPQVHMPARLRRPKSTTSTSCRPPLITIAAAPHVHVPARLRRPKSSARRRRGSGHARMSCPLP